MTRWYALAVAVALCASGVWAADAAKKEGAGVLNHKMKTLAGKDVDLAQYQGKVILVVNVASRCGYTPQYKGLQALHDKYGKDGLVVLGVPCNQFGAQEPGSSDDIAEFCKTKYSVSFDLLEKVDVNGSGACSFYKELTAVDAKPKGAGPVKWNFEKFLIGRDGSVLGRYPSSVGPDDDALVKAIEGALKK
jgi:glutathione peroxidase